MVIGLLLAGAGLLWFTQLTAGSSYVAHVLTAVIVVSIGMGMTFVPMSSTALIGVDPKDAGVASALVNATQQVGSSLGTALLNTVAASATASYLVANSHAAGALVEAPVHGYTTGFFVSAILIFLAAGVTAALIRVPRRDVQPELEYLPELVPERAA
jgi:predicted MFS family arabinose efflux permease